MGARVLDWECLEEGNERREGLRDWVNRRCRAVGDKVNLGDEGGEKFRGAWVNPECDGRR